MTQDINALERDIEESRARLDVTIDRLQDKLSVSGIVDDMLGSMQANRYGSIIEQTKEVLRRNPVPVMLVAAGIGWLLYRTGQQNSARARIARPLPYRETDLPAMNTGQARVYDPDAGAVLPADPVVSDPLAQDPIAAPRNMTARA
jgi:hypothetical protein